VIVAQVRVSLEYLTTRDSARTRGGHCVTHYNPLMLLAGDIGGTKTLVGLFTRDRGRPILHDTRKYLTTSFGSFSEVLDQFARDVQMPAEIDAVAFGVAGPVLHNSATLTSRQWDITVADITQRTGTPRVRLLNDLEAMAYSVEVLTPDELVVLQEGEPNTDAGAAVIAAGTGLGQATLRRSNGRLVPSPSEAGHADFAARNEREMAMVRMLREEYGRVEVEEVISGRGLVNLYRFTHRGGECSVMESQAAIDAAAVSKAGLSGRCQSCAEALRMFVSAYGAEAGNLALRSLSLAGLYIGGGIAPKILPAMTNGTFMAAFLDKAPMGDLVSRIPVKVIVNSDAVLVGAAVCANELGG
jgi:glucokinase